jgi:hypothetical protein
MGFTTPDFLYNTGIRRSLEVLFLTGKLCILEEFLVDFSQNGNAHFSLESVYVVTCIGYFINVVFHNFSLETF